MTIIGIDERYGVKVKKYVITIKWNKIQTENELNMISHQNRNTQKTSADTGRLFVNNYCNIKSDNLYFINNQHILSLATFLNCLKNVLLYMKM